jgi:uncharacterized SAM-binding protein YcdF (DUF218 family)
LFYLLSKPLWFLATPSNALAFVVLVGVGLAYTRFARMGRLLAGAGIVLIVVCGLGPIGNMLMLPLEQRFPPMPPGQPAPYGIIVLGGAVEERVTLAREGGLELNEAAERVTTLVALARRYPEAKLVYSGGTGRFLSQAEVSEAEMVRREIATLGLDPARLIIEGRSRNTAENAVYSATMLRPSAGQAWWLVTSAYHMPRAMGCFRQAGFVVRAYPVDFSTADDADALRPF